MWWVLPTWADGFRSGPAGFVPVSGYPLVPNRVHSMRTTHTVAVERQAKGWQYTNQLSHLPWVCVLAFKPSARSPEVLRIFCTEYVGYYFMPYRHNLSKTVSGKATEHSKRVLGSPHPQCTVPNL